MKTKRFYNCQLNIVRPLCSTQNRIPNALSILLLLLFFFCGLYNSLLNASQEKVPNTTQNTTHVPTKTQRLKNTTNTQKNKTCSTRKYRIPISCTCKAESVIDLFSNTEQRKKAIDWFKSMGVTRVYLETFRHGRMADSNLLRTVKRDFEAAGLDVQGAICPTTKEVVSLANCTARKDCILILRNAAVRTAEIFDKIILDDFLFSTCSCQTCVQARGNCSKSQARCDFLLEIGKKQILAPAKSVNPNVQFYVKFPCWYESYRNAGYDVIRDTQLYGKSWIGTETREPEDPAGGRRPQTQAFWIQAWANDFSKGNCGGAWFDPLGTKPDTFVEQARQSILGGAREILIHSYDYLGTDTPGIAAHGNGKVEFGKADAEAFRHEKERLLQLADLLTDLKPYGVLLAKDPNSEPLKDARMNGFLPLLGIPVLPAASLKSTPADILTLTARSFHDFEARLEENRKIGRPTLLSINLVRDLQANIRIPLGLNETWMKRKRPDTFLEKVNNNLFVIGSERDNWDLMELNQNDLNILRDRLTEPFKFRFRAPTRVSIHLYQSEKRNIQAVENFNNKPVKVELTWTDGQPASRPFLAFPDDNSIKIFKKTNDSIQLILAPRSLAVLEN